jgi:hypothetical protein
MFHADILRCPTEEGDVKENRVGGREREREKKAVILLVILLCLSTLLQLIMYFHFIME